MLTPDIPPSLKPERRSLCQPRGFYDLIVRIKPAVTCLPVDNKITVLVSLHLLNGETGVDDLVVLGVSYGNSHKAPDWLVVIVVVINGKGMFYKHADNPATFEREDISIFGHNYAMPSFMFYLFLLPLSNDL